MEEELQEQVRDRVIDCGLNLLAQAGKSVDSPVVAGLPEMYRTSSLTKDEEFMEHLLSIIYVESKFNKLAVSHAEARGLMQMTAIAVEDAVLSCSTLRPLADMNKLHDSHTNVKYGSCYLKKLNDEMRGNCISPVIFN